MDGIIRSDGAKLSQSIDKQEQRTIITIPRNSRRVLCPFNGMATDSQSVSQSMTVIIDWFDRHQGGRGLVLSGGWLLKTVITIQQLKKIGIERSNSRNVSVETFAGSSL